MIISYDNLWKLLIDKHMNKSELAKKTKISTSTIKGNSTSQKNPSLELLPESP